MPNGCTIVISRGKNKGKQCCDVNRICRHQSVKCPNCGEEFAYKHTYMSHTRLCIASPKRKTPQIIKKSDILERLSTLEQKNRDLEAKVKRVERQPRNINNIMVIGTDFFQELTTKIGKDSAIEFLSLAAVSGKPLDVIDKLYLEGKDPMCYPIACRNQLHFRYLSNEGIVDDRGGTIIGDLVTNRLRNAFLMVANELISKHLDGEVETDSDMLRNMQQNIAAVDKSEIVYQLAEATTNASHPFFKDIEEEG